MSKLIDVSKITTILNKIKTYINNKLSSLVINSDLIADGAITTSKIGGGAITQDKIASSVSFSSDTIINLGNIYNTYWSLDSTYYLCISKYCQTNPVCFNCWFNVPCKTYSRIYLSVKYNSTLVTKFFNISLLNPNTTYTFFRVHFILKYNDGNPTLSYDIEENFTDLDGLNNYYDLRSTLLVLLAKCASSYITPIIDKL